jgi:hypothetical protein
MKSPATDTGSATEAGAPEAAYCSTTQTYSPSYTISGSATYQARVYNGTGLGNAGSQQPIRYAEVVVKDSGGTVVQCTETDGNGDFSFQMPQSGASYTVSVHSRSFNSHLKASVMDTPSTKNYYALSLDFTADGTKTLANMNAPVTGAVLGGAFNILDQLLNANEFLADTVGNCSSTYAECKDVTVAPKVEAYWKKGFNPGSYIDVSSGLSFYLPGYSRLFILGGLNGDVDVTDTDHFDNSVIIHEYGHFLEDNVFRSSSPGGSHNGNKIIDPRLAWSEGWGNFFQAAVQNYVAVKHSTTYTPVYLDTYGNISGGAGHYGHYFEVDLENNATPSYDRPLHAGEGIFREFSVTRILWDMIDNTPTENSPTNDNVSNAFPDIWEVLTSTTHGYSNTSVPFLNIGYFHQFQIWLQGNGSPQNGNDLSNLRSVEMQTGGTAEYAQYVTTGSSCSDYSLTPAVASGDDGTFSTSDLNRNNDFYHLHVSSGQTVTLTLNYQDSDGTGAEADVDLYLYNKNARFGYSTDLVGRSYNAPDGDPTTAEAESLTATLSAGDYMINVFVYTGENGNTPGGPFTYTLKLNGAQLCPSNLVP